MQDKERKTNWLKDPDFWGLVAIFAFLYFVLWLGSIVDLF